MRDGHNCVISCKELLGPRWDGMFRRFSHLGKGELMKAHCDNSSGEER